MVGPLYDQNSATDIHITKDINFMVCFLIHLFAIYNTAFD